MVKKMNLPISWLKKMFFMFKSLCSMIKYALTKTVVNHTSKVAEMSPFCQLMLKSLSPRLMEPIETENQACGDSQETQVAGEYRGFLRYG